MHAGTDVSDGAESAPLLPAVRTEPTLRMSGRRVPSMTNRGCTRVVVEIAVQATEGIDAHDTSINCAAGSDVEIDSDHGFTVFSSED